MLRKLDREQSDVKRGRILNTRLAHAVTAMRYGQFMLVTDAGMSFPDDHRVIDLALTPDVPDLFTVLRALRQELWVERYAFITEHHNPRVVQGVAEIFPDAESTPMSSAWFHETAIHEAAWIVRTGAWMPWGDVALWSGLPVSEWFENTGAPPPAEWMDRLERNRLYGLDGVK